MSLYKRFWEHGNEVYINEVAAKPIHGKILLNLLLQNLFTDGFETLYVATGI